MPFNAQLTAPHGSLSAPRINRAFQNTIEPPSLLGLTCTGITCPSNIKSCGGLNVQCETLRLCIVISNVGT